MIDQVLSFSRFYWEVRKLNRSKKADLVFASSSRLFTAFLGYKIAKKSKATLFLDIRDIFVDTMSDVLKPSFFKPIIILFLKHIENKTFNYASHINLISEGFKEYFLKFKNKSFSFFTNGIDEEFLKTDNSLNQIRNDNAKLIIYAGNIGEGQGIVKIIPQAAKELGNNFTFLIYIMDYLYIAFVFLFTLKEINFNIFIYVLIFFILLLELLLKRDTFIPLFIISMFPGSII